MRRGYFLDNIEGMHGYVPGEQVNDADVIKLNSNENPYPPSPKVLARLRQPRTVRCGVIPSQPATPCGPPRPVSTASAPIR